MWNREAAKWRLEERKNCKPTKNEKRKKAICAFNSNERSFWLWERFIACEMLWPHCVVSLVSRRDEMRSVFTTSKTSDEKNKIDGEKYSPFAQNKKKNIYIKIVNVFRFGNVDIFNGDDNAREKSTEETNDKVSSDVVAIVIHWIHGPNAEKWKRKKKVVDDKDDGGVCSAHNVHNFELLEFKLAIAL